MREHPSDQKPPDRGGALSVETTSALFAEDLVVRYPTSTEPAVECQGIDLPEGAVTALVGPNESSKRALTKHLEPETGELVGDGPCLREYGDKELARRLGHLSRKNDSPDNLTVKELGLHGRYPHREVLGSVSEADRRAVDQAIDLARIEALREQEVRQLSGGQKRLVWIAMVLARGTTVLP